MLKTKILGDKNIVPAVMFHSVGIHGTGPVINNLTEPIFNYLSESFCSFEKKLFSLKRSGYNFIFWEQLYLYMKGTSTVRLPAIMLTFDDGYLDNWVYVFPLLKKYEARATIFVNPEFVDPASKIRHNLEDVWKGRIKKNELQTHGFLNWEEMRVMEESGFVDIQSHSLTHTWHFSKPKLIDFHKPGDNRFPWIAWNKYPDKKPYYLNTDQSNLIPLGTPIYEYEKALICRKYFPPEEVTKKLTDFTDINGGAEFFCEKDWEVNLRDLHNSLMTKYKNNQHYETEDEYRKRILNELISSKHIIEKNLKKKVKFISWPGGGYNDIVLELSLKAGYKSWTLGSRDQPHNRNVPGSDSNQIKRIGSGNKQYFLKKCLSYKTGRGFIYAIKRHQNSLYHKYGGRFLKALRYLRSFLPNSFQTS